MPRRANLTPVFEAMLEKATRLCEARFGISCATRTSVQRAGRGVSADFAEIAALRQRCRHHHAGPTPYRHVGGRAFVHVHDLQTDESVQRRRSGRSPGRVGGVRTFSFVPLRKEGDIARLHSSSPAGGPAVLRQADRAARKLRGAGGHRDGQCPAAAGDPPAPGRIAGHLRQHGRRGRDVRRRNAARCLEPEFPADPRSARCVSRRAAELAEYFRYIAARGEYGVDRAGSGDPPRRRGCRPAMVALRTHAAGRHGSSRCGAIAVPGGGVRPDLQRHHRAEARRSRDPRRTRRRRSGARGN